MPTPRPFNAQTGFTETPLGEINRQVQRMQKLGGPPATKAPAAKQGLSAFTERILGIKNNFKAGLQSSGAGLSAIPVMGPLRSILRVTGGSTALSPDPKVSATDRMIGGFQAVAPLYGTAVAGASNIAEWMRQNLSETDFTSGRGSGAKALVSQKQRDADLTAQAETLKPYFPDAAYVPEREVRAVDPKRTSGGGLDTSDGKVKENPDFVNMENVNTLLGGFGIKGFTPNAEFNSNQLPTTSSNPNDDFSPDDAQVMGVPKDDARLMQSGGGVETVFTDGKESSTQIFKDPGSRAFLDYEGKGGSMGAFRAAERARGMVRVGGRNYITNPLAGQDGESDFRAITDQERRDVNAGRITAQDVSDRYIQRINAPVPGEFKPAMPEIGSYSDQNLANTGDRFSKLVEEEIEMPDFSRKLGLNFGTQPNTGMFAIDPEVFKYVSRDAYNSNVMKD